jgi:Outer membrane phospholipase A
MFTWKALLFFVLVSSQSVFANQLSTPPESEEGAKTSTKADTKVEKKEKEDINGDIVDEKEKILTRAEALRILYYKPMYFAYGNPSAKVQLSFRVPLFEEIPLNFAYTQVIFWELGEESKPFLDATYNPEFFYRLNSKNPLFPALDFGIFEHNSNGKGDDLSRSYNQSYLRSVWAFDTKKWVTAFYVKARYIYDLDENNRDLVDYIGPLEFGLKFVQRINNSWLDHLDVMLTATPGGKYSHEWDKGGYQLSFDFHLGGVKVVPAFYLQYYHGYSETLLNYNEKVDQFRGGVMF